ncbi:MAG: DnaJ domain-containing protein [Nitrospinae bacterium]|nr:DnaJ domain-containing protein [Nitrospinota bacterium]MBL7019099.1 DnaJ domain-containing protein [Nitrospinaceae bacterium]
MQIAECFEILNVSPGEEWPRVRKSYHSLARQLHPDINQSNTPSGDTGDTRLKEINRAFAKLETHYKTHALPVHQEPYGKEQPKWRALFKTLAGNPALQAALRSGLNFLEDLDNKIFQLDIQKDIKLSGAILQKGGSLYLKSGKERFEVKIPSGDWNQMSLRVHGKGESSLFSHRRGDLLLNLCVPIAEIAIPGNSRFSYQMKIPADKIADRKALTLNSSEGPIKFILPRNTRDGQSFTLRSNAGTETLHVLALRLG